MSDLDDVRRQLRSATERLTRANRQLLDLGSERRVWGSAEVEEHRTARDAGERAKQQRDTLMQRIIDLLEAGEE